MKISWEKGLQLQAERTEKNIASKNESTSM